MPRAVVLSAVRTPIGRYGGALSGVRPDDLAGVAIAAAVERAGIDGAAIEDVYFGCANQAGEDNRNVARMGALLAGLPDSVAGVTLNRLCASGLSAVVSASHAVLAGDADVVVAGGVESMSRAPLVMAKPDAAFPRGNQTVWDTTLGWRFPNPRLEELFPLESMGETGENVAERWGVSREEQDAFALRSQERWAAAQEAGRFDDELVRGGRGRGRRASAAADDCRGARGAETGVPFGRHRYGGQRERDQRRCGSARDRERAREPRSSGSTRSARSSGRRSRVSTLASWASAPCRRCASCSSARASSPVSSISSS